MFSRLMKYEWRANSRLFGILSLAVCGVGLAATLVLRLLVSGTPFPDEYDSVFGYLFVAAMCVFLFFCAIAVCVYVLAIQFLSLYRFHKNKFTDEGYLTFTLPVTATQIFWSSFLSMLLWLVISAVVAVAVVAVVILFGTARGELVNTELLRELSETIPFLIRDLQPLLTQELTPVYLIAQGLSVAITPFYALIIPMACITVGAMLAKKHKILAAFGIYYAVNFVFGIVSSLVNILPMLILMNGDDSTVYYVVNAFLELGLKAALTVGAYFLTVHLMKHRLNLP